VDITCVQIYFMRLLITLCAFSLVTLPVFAQAPKKPVPASKPVQKAGVKKPTAAVKTFKSSIDSFSYAVGVSLASFYKEQGVANLNTSLVIQALNDVKAGKSQFSEEQVNTCIMGFIQEAKSEKAAESKKEGRAFLEQNKSKPGVTTTASGLQYSILKTGTGPTPGADDQVRVHYHGTLLDGRIFDSSVDRGEPIVLGLRNVIAGWTEALQLMPVGSKWKLFIPSELGYGDNGAGAMIKPGSALIFEVELLEIVK
jgi:FKBP-type peptidyl-prolyl cis-trans isomerase FklB